MVRDLAIGGGIILATILCPPLGAAAAVVYGAVQIKSGIDGEDWGTHRKLSQEERVGNIIFGGLDAIPVVGAVGKGVKAFKGTNELADLAKLLKFKEGMPGFNPNLGKNVVQSLKENNLLKNLKIQGWKTVDKINDADYFIKGLVAKGADSVSPIFKGVEIMPDGSVARTGTNYSGKFQEAHDASKASIQSRISNLESGGVKGTGETVKKIGDINDPIRTYRGADLGKLEAKYTADPRLTVEMPYVGKGQKNTNAEGWLRDKDFYWKEMLENYPEAFNRSNRQKIELGFAPINNPTFRKHFPQYDLKELYNDTLIHHHIGGGGQAVAVPSKLHPGLGGIHNAEKSAGVWGNDQKYAELLEKFLEK
ncbi:hypothetical protein BWGOE8_32500 [Bacillus mycoides]|uniref:Tox-HNH-HHH domain-containing protein n=1 Tax=Bacillus mycoides TaxID=1405 RepID=A0A1E8B5S7_BACMY|nr:hypothetical protein BWGOE8_32500 [Bacillus mycoides]OFD77668.1 hypothetical protein BWGOE9_32560 [Bacillus mycoides]OFD79068.1 hypothetical protein BWGOE10_32980 [Bacillus mycoides]